MVAAGLIVAGTVAATAVLVTHLGGPGHVGPLGTPAFVAVDAAGNLYVATDLTYQVRKVDRQGKVTTVVGNGTSGFSGDGGPATSAQLNYPSALAVDAGGNLYIADHDNHRVRKVDRTGTITTIAGTGTDGQAGDGGPATSAQLSEPQGLAVDAGGNLYIADAGGHGSPRVRKVDRSGVIITAAGHSTSFDDSRLGDGGPATSAQLLDPVSLAVDGAGSLYIADHDLAGGETCTGKSLIRKVDRSGVITTVAGTRSNGAPGDGGPATSAALCEPDAVAVDADGNIYIADRGSSPRIRRVSSSGTITTVAGTGARGYSGDGGPATSAALSDPNGLAIDAGGNLYIADVQVSGVRKIDRSGIITTVAG